MELYVLADDGGPSVRFEGVQLARVNSWKHGKPRWVEMALYRTRGGNYVVERVAHYVDRNEPSRIARVYREPRSVIEDIVKHGASRLTGLTRTLLEEAADKDEGIDAAFDDWTVSVENAVTTVN